MRSFSPALVAAGGEASVKRCEILTISADCKAGMGSTSEIGWEALGKHSSDES